MLVLFDRKRLESALPNVPARAVEFVVTTDVRVLQPMHPPTQIAIGGGLEHEMKVIRHQTVSQHRHRHSGAGMGDRLEKSLVVAVFEEHLPPPIPPVPLELEAPPVPPPEVLEVPAPPVELVVPGAPPVP